MQNSTPSKEARGWIRNLILVQEGGTEQDTLFFGFRPKDVSENISVSYSKMSVLGQSHQYSSFSNTNDTQFSFELFENVNMLLKERKESPIKISKQLETDRRFLESLALPYSTPNGQIGASNPDLLLCIPGIVSTRCRLVNANFTFDQVDRFGNLLQWTAMVTFEEAPKARVTCQDHLASGFFRNW